MRLRRDKQMFCKKCGDQIEEGAAFCKRCGTPVEKVGNVAIPSAAPVNVLVNARYLKIGIIIACLFMALATALPYLVLDDKTARYVGTKSMSLLNANGQAGDGIIFIIIAILTVVFLYLRKNIPLLICGIIPFLMYCYELKQIKKAEEMILGYSLNVDDFMSKGPGFYFLTVSVIALLALSILFFAQDRKQNG